MLARFQYDSKKERVACLEKKATIILMVAIITTIQVILSILLIVCILLQHRTSGLSSTFGGSGAVFVQRRGAERVIYLATGWLATGLLLLSILQWYVS